MRRVDFHPDALADQSHRKWWRDWRKRADRARTRALEAWDKWASSRPRTGQFEYEFNDNVWGDLKLWVATHLFRMKCAYCESPLTFDRYRGDAEHFRPKGRVTIVGPGGARIRPRCILPDGIEIDHPGYFWLAYDWRNLVPACSFCNSGDAKVDQFPAETHFLLQQLSAEDKAALSPGAQADLIPSVAWPGWYLLGPQALDELERPSLLNPLNPLPGRLPSEHLRYSLGGKVHARDDSPVGAESIRVYKLDRGDLDKYRQQAQEQIQYAYFVELASPAPDRAGRVERALQPFRQGERDFSSAALDYLEEQRGSLPAIRP